MPMTMRKIDDITVGRRTRREMGDVAALAKSIRESGLMHPVVICPDGRLIAGARRVAAFKLLGHTKIPVTILDVAWLARGELAENAQRKDFTPSELVEISRAVEAEERELARARQSLAGGSASGKLPEAIAKGDARDRTAARIGAISGRTLEKARAVVDAAERDPATFGKLRKDMDRTGRVHGPYKRLKVMQQSAEIRRSPQPLPRGPFPVIVVDPPWPYEVLKADPTHRGTHPYPQMAMTDICALPIPSIAAENCVLWLWVTNHHMPEAFAVLDAWGFTQKTILTWAKDRMGRGDWLRGQSEHALMTIRGNPIVTLTNQTTLLHAATREHSRKPDEFFAFVESLCPAPAGGYASIFERYKRPGWVLWGDEAPAAVAA
jgi:N6-adenosine-specific RNA methylase IME4